MSDKIGISEIYGPVLQGEGPSCGRPTIFVRSFGCDSYCAMCDSLYAVDPAREDARYQFLTPEQIVDRIECIDNELSVTFSGGNPALWDMGPVLTLLGPDRSVWVETQGTYWRDWLARCEQVVVSPKGPFMADRKHGLTPFSALDKFHQELSAGCLFFKVVIGDAYDLDYAEAIAKRYWRPIFLSVGCPRTKGVMQPDIAASPAEALLDRYRHLSELLIHSGNALRWKELRARALFLPQMHVLAYGDARGI